jgi:enamine deaminase RidA (YjgF/YER057c/UK114 family)
MKKIIIFLCCFTAISHVLFSQEYNPEKKILELGIELKEPSTPIANYINVVRTGNLLFLSGKGPLKSDGTYVTGKLGVDLTIEEGYNAAKLVAINQLAVLKKELGNLNRVKRIIKVLGMVQCNNDFTNHPKVINGFSDIMVAVFGEKGKHARSAVGMVSLPNNIAVEIELIVEVEN